MANAYYRVGQYYYDTSAKALWRCKTAGDKTSSVWEQVAGAGGTGWNYRGVWVSTSTYVTNDVVLLGPGTSAGLYLSLIDNNTYQPDSSIGWVQLSSYMSWL